LIHNGWFFNKFKQDFLFGILPYLDVSVNEFQLYGLIFSGKRFKKGGPRCPPFKPKPTQTNPEKLHGFNGPN
jgi:hypothetical protein